MTQRPVTVNELLALAERHGKKQVIDACRAFLVAHGERKGDRKAPEFCLDPERCVGQGYCPRDIACNH